jgi:predicted HicB family RNase H-like nuclease
MSESQKHYQTTSFKLPANMHRTLRIMAIAQGISMGKAVEQAVEAWMRENGRRGPQPGDKAAA